ncbi:MAG: PilW family protein [Burkholderiales bacterium]|nr:PilW family protein [Burkholderiales bacterium]
MRASPCKPSFEPRTTLVTGPRAVDQSGLSLIELIIGLSLGLVMVLAMGYLYVHGRQGYRLNDNLARIQENARIALETIGRDVRMTGFIACSSLNHTQPRVLAQTPPSPLTAGGLLSAADSLSGVDTGASGTWAGIPASLSHVPGTDVLLVARASEQIWVIEAAMAHAGAVLTVGHADIGLQTNDLVVVSDCMHTADLFRASTVATSGGTTTIGHDATANVSANLSRDYPAGSRLGAFQIWQYFVARDTSGQIALYRRPLHRPATPQADWVVADGIADLQIHYGVDADGDGRVEAFRTATQVTTAGAWARVIALRVTLVLAGPDDHQVASPQTLVYRDDDGDGELEAKTMPDRRLYQMFSTTISLRNRSA